MNNLHSAWSAHWNYECINGDYTGILSPSGSFEVVEIDCTFNFADSDYGRVM